MDAPPPSMVPLEEELRALPADLRQRLDASGFSADRLIALAKTLDGSADERAARRDARNRVKGPVRVPTEGEIPRLPGDPAALERLRSKGAALLQRGGLAFCVLAGGMATRMGGVVKALVEAIPGRSFLDLRLAENRVASERAGQPVPLWLMTSEPTDGPTRDALRERRAPPHVAVFRQDLSLRLTPEGQLFRGDDGAPSTYAPGHGDLVDALRRSGLLGRFLEKDPGGVVWIANLDNLGAGIDEAILGAFLESGKDVMVEVCEKAEGDKGGIPVHAQGKLQVLEEFRLPLDFDPAAVRVFNTNTFLVRASALQRAAVAWNWFEVEKKVDGRKAVQFERLLQELTGALDAGYLHVPREGATGRFLPAKDRDELARRRGAIEAIVQARGFGAAAPR